MECYNKMMEGVIGNWATFYLPPSYTIFVYNYIPGYWAKKNKIYMLWVPPPQKKKCLDTALINKFKFITYNL